ncbi:alpha-1,2 glucosyltransferase-like protein alg10 [Cryomyces antarcticus]
MLTEWHAVAPVAITALGQLSWLWLDNVSTIVPDPYLDEVFHIRQAQTYCAGDFARWDPKITTPPGLYILSYAVFKVTGRCSTFDLRALNLFLMLGVYLVTLLISTGQSSSMQQQVESRAISRIKRDHRPSQHSRLQATLYQGHTALNVALFPPLFFFSALYYTDVASTLLVLLSYYHFIKSYHDGGPGLVSNVLTVLYGTTSLLFRQTNIFWVALFPAGLAVIGALKDMTMKQRELGGVKSNALSEVLRTSWEDSVVYDIPVRNAYVEDYMKVALSLAVTTVRNVQTVFRVLVPYLTILGIFGAFVLWNGGVVLGDKSNHIATLHLPQMLYLWPYVTFFSFPLIYPYFLQGFIALIAGTPTARSLEFLLVFSRNRVLPRFHVAAGFFLAALPVIRFNTIVHPFTLADNRHYMFYVFRLLNRYPVTKYLAAPVYFVCGWAIVQSLGGPLRQMFSAENLTSASSQFKANRGERMLSRPSEGESCKVSFVVVWLATTALTLVTAPLVEPRYFILPWLMWRLNVPSPASSSLPENNGESGASASQTSKGWADIKSVLWSKHDHRLWLETAWFLIVNAVTGHVFLYRTFEWPQEPGRVQRFMW